MHLTINFHSSLLMILKISLVYTQNTQFRLNHNPIHFQIQYTILLEFFYRFACLKPFLTNSKTTHIQVFKSLPVLSLNITTYLILTSGFPFSYVTVLNVNVMNTSKLKYKLLLHNFFQSMLLPIVTESQWTPKVLSFLLHNTNLIFTL